MRPNERLRAVRRARGLKQWELATLVGVTQAAISRYERGDATPGQRITLRLVEVLGVESPRAIGYTLISSVSVARLEEVRP